MNNRIKLSIILFSVVLVTGLVLIFAFLQQKNSSIKQPVAPPQSSPAVSFYPKPTFAPLISPTASVSLPSAQDEKITVSNIKMNNFYRSPIRVYSSGDVVVAQSDSYQIAYLPLFNKFIISIVSSPFQDKIKGAEEDFIKALGISREEACRLNAVVNTPFFANPDESGKDYPLSFCLPK